MSKRSSRSAWTLAITLGLLFAAACAQAAGSSFVPMDVGARATAMGSAYLALADDASATVWNPAALAEIGRPDAFYAPQDFPDSGTRQDFGAVSFAGARSGFGVSFGETDLSGLVGFDYHERTVTLAYGIDWGRVSVGVGVNRLLVTNDFVDADGWSTTLAFKYTDSNNIRYAVRLRDLISRLEWDDGFVEKPDLALDLGVARDMDGGRLWGKVTAAIAYTGFGDENWRDGFKLGLEAHPSKKLALRTGLANGHATAGLGYKMGSGSLDLAWGFEPALGAKFVVSGSVAF